MPSQNPSQGLPASQPRPPQPGPDLFGFAPSTSPLKCVFCPDRPTRRLIVPEEASACAGLQAFVSQAPRAGTLLHALLLAQFARLAPAYRAFSRDRLAQLKLPSERRHPVRLSSSSEGSVRFPLHPGTGPSPRLALLRHSPRLSALISTWQGNQGPNHQVCSHPLPWIFPRAQPLIRTKPDTKPLRMTLGSSLWSSAATATSCFWRNSRICPSAIRL